MRLSHLIAGGAALLTLTGTAVAATQVPLVFGHHPPAGWRPPTLSSTCQRMPTTIRYGKTLHSLKVAITEESTIVDLELKCTRRLALQGGKSGGVAPNCFAQVGPPPSETVYHGDDWEATNLADARRGIDDAGSNGVDASAAWMKALYQCEVGS